MGGILPFLILLCQVVAQDQESKSKSCRTPPIQQNPQGLGFYLFTKGPSCTTSINGIQQALKEEIFLKAGWLETGWRIATTPDGVSSRFCIIAPASLGIPLLDASEDKNKRNSQLDGFIGISLMSKTKDSHRRSKPTSVKEIWR